MTKSDRSGTLLARNDPKAIGEVDAGRDVSTPRSTVSTAPALARVAILSGACGRRHIPECSRETRSAVGQAIARRSRGTPCSSSPSPRPSSRDTRCICRSRGSRASATTDPDSRTARPPSSSAPSGQRRGTRCGAPIAGGRPPLAFEAPVIGGCQSIRAIPVGPPAGPMFMVGVVAGCSPIAIGGAAPSSCAMPAAP